MNKLMHQINEFPNYNLVCKIINFMNYINFKFLCYYINYIIIIYLFKYLFHFSGVLGFWGLWHSISKRFPLVTNKYL